VIRIALAGALTLALAASGAAQSAPVATARLGMTKTPGVLASGVVQLELGYSQAHQQSRTRHAIGETLLRVGLGASTEARLGISSYTQTVNAGAVTAEGMGDAFVALKHRFARPAGLRPSTSVMLSSTLPTGAGSIGAGAAQPEVSVSAEWALSQRFRLLAMGNQRSAVTAGNRYGQTMLTTALRASLAPALVVQADYGHTSVTREGVVDVNQLRAGAALRITPALQADAWIGRAPREGAPAERLLGVGLTHRW